MITTNQFRPLRSLNATFTLYWRYDCCSLDHIIEKSQWGLMDSQWDFYLVSEVWWLLIRSDYWVVSMIRYGASVRFLSHMEGMINTDECKSLRSLMRPYGVSMRLCLLSVVWVLVIRADDWEILMRPYGVWMRLLPPMGGMVTTHLSRSLRSLNETLWSLNETFTFHQKYDLYLSDRIGEKSQCGSWLSKRHFWAFDLILKYFCDSLL